GSRPARMLAVPARGARWRDIVRLGGAWLASWLVCSGLAALMVGHWIRYTTGVAPLLCFVLIGPIREELLFRGALFEWAERGWSSSSRWNPIVATTLPFALQHFQFHHYQISAAALLQVGFTIPMGIVFGRLRQLSGS